MTESALTDNFGALVEAMNRIKELGYSEIAIDSRVEAIPFYEKLGYEIFKTEKGDRDLSFAYLRKAIRT